MIYLILFCLSVFLTYMMIIISHKKNILDIPNERSSHAVSTPRGGGISIILTSVIGILYFHYVSLIPTVFVKVMFLGVILSLVGFLDDIYTLSSKVRLIIQLLIGTATVYILDVSIINLDFITINNAYLVKVFSVIVIVWFINLFNFLDGINGYAGMEGVFVMTSASLFFAPTPLFITLVSSILGFLVWNWGKAKIFMGDSGSTYLGFWVGAMTLNFQASDSSIFLWCIIFSLFLFDATFTLIKRILRRERITQAHRSHIYQKMVQYGWSHQKMTLFGLLINCFLLGVTFVAFRNNQFTNAFILLIITFFLGVLILNKKFKILE